MVFSARSRRPICCLIDPRSVIAQDLVCFAPARLLDGLVHLQSGQEVAGSFVMAVDVDATDTQVVTSAYEIRGHGKRLLVCRNGFLGSSTVGQRGAKAVPEEMKLFLLVGRTDF
ncbi:hypothetical protein HG531_013957 [Fusarium graminearum]|nr:hypothetical protein HG531_013957 [Fusarium graminearum]